MQKHLYLSVFFVAAFCYHADAQMALYTKTLNAAGRSANINSNTYEWSVGEMTLVSTASNASLTVTQGVLQPYLAPTGVTSTSKFSGSVEVFPNPAQSLLNLQYIFETAGAVAYTLQDIAGRELLRSTDKDVQAGKGNSTINLAGFPSGHYMLYVVFRPVSGSAPESVAFKIEKN